MFIITIIIIVIIIIRDHDVAEHLRGDRGLRALPRGHVQPEGAYICMYVYIYIYMYI